MNQARGEVYDIGYQSYTGPRQGRSRARIALWINGIRTALGLGRGWPSKILPILLMFFLITPAIVFSLVASTLDVADNNLPDLSDFYQIASVILIIFSAIIAPELLCADRRNGVINLYLVRPLTSTDYVLGRWFAFLSVTLIYVYVPQVVLLLGLVLGAPDPADYLQNNWLDIPRFLVAGLALALFTTTLPLAAAAFTTRRAYAAAFVIGLWFVAAATAGALTESIDQSWVKWFTLIDIGNAPIYINDLVFDKAPEGDLQRLARQIPEGVGVLWYLLLIALPGALLWWRYRRLMA